MSNTITKCTIDNYARFFLFAWVIMLLSLFGCAKTTNNPGEYTFSISEGTPLRENFPKDFKPIYPVLTISQGKKTLRYSLPLGTEIWQDKSDVGCLVLKYMDRRFSAFGSDAFVLVDLKEIEFFTVITDVIHEIESGKDDILIGVQRIPNNVDYSDNSGDTDYYDCIQNLFLIKFDYTNRRFHRMNILTGKSLPDSNQMINDELRAMYTDRFFVKDGVLYYSKDKTIRTITLKDFEKNFMPYTLIEK